MTEKITDNDLNNAADLLGRQLPKGAQELIDVLALDNKVPKWWCVCGMLMEAYIAGRMAAMTFDPDWHKGFRQPSGRCAMCHKNFEPKQIGQKYCTNECGNAAHLTSTLKSYEEQLEVERARVEAIKLKLPKTEHFRISVSGIISLEQLIGETKQEIQRLMGDLPTEEGGGEIKAGDDAPVDGSVAHKLDGAGDGLYTDPRVVEAREKRAAQTGEELVKTLRNRSVQAKRGQGESPPAHAG